jgi:hypothetical protein
MSINRCQGEDVDPTLLIDRSKNERLDSILSNDRPKKQVRGRNCRFIDHFPDDRCPALVATHRENGMRLNRGVQPEAWAQDLRLHTSAQKDKSPTPVELTGVLVQIKTTTKKHWHLLPQYLLYGFGKGYLNFPSQLPLLLIPVVNIEYAELEHTGPLPPERRIMDRKKARLDRSPSQS